MTGQTVAHALLRAASRLFSTPALDHGYCSGALTNPAFTGLFSIYILMRSNSAWSRTQWS